MAVPLVAVSSPVRILQSTEPEEVIEQQVKDHDILEGGGLASAVDAKETKALAMPDSKAQVVDGGEGAKPLGQIGY